MSDQNPGEAESGEAKPDSSNPNHMANQQDAETEEDTASGGAPAEPEES